MNELFKHTIVGTEFSSDGEDCVLFSFKHTLVRVCIINPRIMVTKPMTSSKVTMGLEATQWDRIQVGYQYLSCDRGWSSPVRRNKGSDKATHPYEAEVDGYTQTFMPDGRWLAEHMDGLDLIPATAVEKGKVVKSSKK